MTRSVLSLCSLCLFLISPGLRAEFTCARPVIQEGEIRSGVTLRHRFILTSQSKETIQVDEVKPGCGCLKAVIDRRTVKPGETAAVDVEIGTVTQASGPNRWRVTVRYREGAQSAELPLEVLAHVVREVSIQPASVILHTSRSIRHAFTLRELRDRPLEVRGVTSSCQHVEGKLSVPRKEEEAWIRTLSLNVLPDTPDGRYEGTLCIHTTDASCPELKVPYTIVKRAANRVQVSPSSVELLASPGVALPSRIVLLGCDAEHAVLVERVETGHEAIRCTFAPGPGVRSTLRVVIDGDRLPPGAYRGNIKVHLREPAGEVIHVPVRVVR